MGAVATCVGFLIALTGCDFKDESAREEGSPVRISGELLTGLATEGVRMGVRMGVRAGQEQGVRAGEQEGVRMADIRREAGFETGVPLPGYSLFCVTFQDPPRGGRGTAAEDGRFVLEIGAAGISFGCFVLDPSERRVADLSFLEESRAPDGNFNLRGTARLEGDTDLGTVLVDASTAVALADQLTASTTAGQEVWDYTGGWIFGECLDAQSGAPCKAEELILYSAFVAQYPSFYLNRLGGTDLAAGGKRYLGDIWSSREAYTNCGSTEGVTRERGREVYGMELDSAANEVPFRFLSEPPGGGSWDPSDSCLGPVVFEGPHTEKCSSVPDLGVRDYCYESCLTRRLVAADHSCVRARRRNDDYINAYLQQRSQAAGPSYDRSQFLQVIEFPEQAVLTDLGSTGTHPEIFYSDPDTWSGVLFGVNAFQFLDAAGAVHTCDIVGSVQLNVSQLSPGVADVTAFLSFAHSVSNPDFAWCKTNATRSSRYTVPLTIGTNVHLRGRIRAEP